MFLLNFKKALIKQSTVCCLVHKTLLLNVQFLAILKIWFEQNINCTLIVRVSVYYEVSILDMYQFNIHPPNNTYGSKIEV